MTDKYVFDSARKLAGEIHTLIVDEVQHSISLSLVIEIAAKIREWQADQKNPS